ncbi:DUF3992 domain-containing protein [Paenibacillus sp. MCAF20]
MCANTTLTCCSDKTFVQDKVCINWQFTAGGSQTVFTNNLSQNINASGYVKFESGAGIVTVNFIRTGVVTPIQQIVITPSSSATFTVARFDTIALVATAAGQGEFCITVRYPL